MVDLIVAGRLHDAAVGYSAARFNGEPKVAVTVIGCEHAQQMGWETCGIAA
jgi:hypothetical protein